MGWILILVLVSGVDGWGTKKTEVVKIEFNSMKSCLDAKSQIILNDWDGGSAITQAYCIEK